MRNVIVGLGVVGSALYELFKEVDPEGTFGLDKGTIGTIPRYARFLHVCLPYNSEFIQEVNRYQDMFDPEVTIIHSTVPIGTTEKFKNAVHSPVQGRHLDMKSDLKRAIKWIAGQDRFKAANCLEEIGIETRCFPNSRTTEALKLLCLAKYGMSIAFAQYQSDIVDHQLIREWDNEYNGLVLESQRRPILYPPGKVISGTCIIPGVKMLDSTNPNPILKEILKFSSKPELESEPKTIIWPPSNIYPTAKIGHGVSIGAFSEIGNNVIIGNNVRIGAMTFVPEGVVIEDNCWIGPRVTFSNDRYPPSPKSEWKTTRICQGARLGAAVCVLPGVTIGENALIGMGSVITKNVPAGVKVVGNPGKELCDD